MSTGSDSLLKELRQLISEDGSKLEKLQRAAALIRNSGTYRWVGLYEIDREANEVFSFVWDGPGAPKYPRFPISKGLTGVAIKELKVVNVGDVTAASRYLRHLVRRGLKLSCRFLMRVETKLSAQSMWKASALTLSMRRAKAS